MPTGIVIALPGVGCLVPLAFLTPSYNPGARDLPLTLAGPEATVGKGHRGRQ